VPDAGVRGFALARPQGAPVSAIEGRGSDGCVLLRAEDVAGAMASLPGEDPGGAQMNVVPAG
jgi:hypothetical protein